MKLVIHGACLNIRSSSFFKLMSFFREEKGRHPDRVFTPRSTHSLGKPGSCTPLDMNQEPSHVGPAVLPLHHYLTPDLLLTYLRSLWRPSDYEQNTEKMAGIWLLLHGLAWSEELFFHVISRHAKWAQRSILITGSANTDPQPIVTGDHSVFPPSYQGAF